MHKRQFHPNVPANFAEMLALNAENTLRQWLKNNNAPAEVVALVDATDTLRAYAKDIRQSAADTDCYDIASCVVDALAAIDACGGTFSCGVWESDPVQNPVTWTRRPTTHQE